jgi:uncharacterized membrane protein HdeD (DUF308 family)
MELELIFGLASLIFGIYNMLLFFSTGVYTHLFLGIIFLINGLYFMKTGKNSLDNGNSPQKPVKNSK